MLKDFNSDFTELVESNFELSDYNSLFIDYYLVSTDYLGVSNFRPFTVQTFLLRLNNCVLAGHISAGAGLLDYISTIVCRSR